MKIAIQGMGVVGAFGCGAPALIGALSSGNRSITLGPAPFLPDRPEWPVYRADTSELGRFIPARRLRRMDHYSKMGLLGALLALEDSGAEPDRNRLGIIVATGHGAARTTFKYQDSIIDGGDIGSSPTLFSHSVHNAAAANISILLGIRGPSLTVSQFELSVASALLTATLWLAEGRVDAVLFGSIDEYCDVMGYCSARAYDKDGFPRRMQPLELGLQSAIAGEGAAFFLLSRDTSAPDRYGHIRDVRTGMIPDAPVAPSGEVIILGADGEKACGSGYRKLLPPAAPVAAYTPLYGSFPSSQAFDLAVAALCRSGKTLFPSPGAGGETHTTNVVETHTPLGNRDIRCIKCNPDGRFGSILCGF
jgi:3-oxoacyl-[acyl-carrier-protein] synthase II